MRTLSLAAMAWLWPIALTAQDRVAVNLHLTIPDFLGLDVERESVVSETGTHSTRQIYLRVHANRTWALVVTCDAGAGAEVSATGEWVAAQETADVRWRNALSDQPAQTCAGGSATAAEGVRGDESRVVLEITAPRDNPGTLRYALIPR